MTTDTRDELSLLDLALPIVRHAGLIVLGSIAIGLAALGATYLVKPTFIARTTFMPPQQQHSAAASALASLGALAALGGVGNGVKNPAEQYVALMGSHSVTDRLIDEFDLLKVYGVTYRFQAREQLAENVRIAVSAKHGMVSVEVEDTDPKRAAALANRHVDELRRLSTELALSEAQQRRVFFDQELKRTRDRLADAQRALQSSGFSEGSLRSEPKAAAEGYAQARAALTNAEVRLQMLRRSLAETTPEVAQQQALVGALRQRLAQVEQSIAPTANADYVGKYREFKYQEALFELFARQYEVARLDESREGALIQVVDVATVPEWKSKPRRALIAVASTAVGFVFLVLFVLARHFLRLAALDPRSAEKVRRLRAAFGRQRKDEA